MSEIIHFCGITVFQVSLFKILTWSKIWITLNPQFWSTFHILQTGNRSTLSTMNYDVWAYALFYNDWIILNNHQIGRQPEISAEHFTRNSMIVLNLTCSHLLTILYCSMHMLVWGKWPGVKSFKHFQQESNRMHVGGLTELKPRKLPYVFNNAHLKSVNYTII
jgi:hypothetical protein